jgi:hypothetical protein
VRACNLHPFFGFLVYDVHSPIDAVNEISIYSGCTIHTYIYIYIYVQVCRDQLLIYDIERR